ncbi:MAG: S41 family peptidase [Clostridium sp.]|nr:S41 family peptidase [Clostridium sp.]
MQKYLFKKNNNNKKWFVLCTICFMLVLCLSTLFLGNYMATKGIFLVRASDEVKSTAVQKNNIDKYSSLFLVRDNLIEKFDGEVDDDKLLEGAIKGMTSALDDPYTVFMNNDEFEKLMKQSNGSMTGIGVTVASIEDKITILSVLKDSPAEKAGLVEKDIIEKIDDTEYSGDKLSDAVTAITSSGDSGVKLTIKRGEADFVDVNIVPEKVKITVIDGEMLDSQIGYIRIKSFMNENTAEDLKNEIKQLQGSGMKGLIIDLRENPGGLLSQAVGVASQFIPQGKVITYTVDKYDNRNESLSVGGIAEGVPLVLLVNGNSASASEVVTGALRDYGAATIVGNTTFGKGIVQQTLKFNNGIGGLKVTISKYYTPNGENIHKIGIKPDYDVSTPVGIDEAGYDRKSDNQLNTAIEKLQEKIN